jgi:hypothetical protein
MLAAGCHIPGAAAYATWAGSISSMPRKIVARGQTPRFLSLVDVIMPVHP